MCAYGCPSVRLYLRASCVRVSMLPFVCVHVRVRDCVYVSPSVRPSVCPSVYPRACSCVQRFDRTSLRSSMHAFVCLHARVPEGVRPSVCLSACMFVRPNDCSHMCAFINACAAFLTSNFHVCTWVFASVRICAYVYPSVRMYLSASCVRVSMLAFVLVHVRVREGVCVSPSVRPSVHLSVRVHVRASKCLIVHVHACVHQCMCSCGRLSVSLSACMFVHPNVCSHMRAFINACAAFLISNFKLLTSYF